MRGLVEQNLGSRQKLHYFFLHSPNTEQYFSGSSGCSKSYNYDGGQRQLSKDVRSAKLQTLLRVMVWSQRRLCKSSVRCRYCMSQLTTCTVSNEGEESGAYTKRFLIWSLNAKLYKYISSFFICLRHFDVKLIQFVNIVMLRVASCHQQSKLWKTFIFWERLLVLKP